MAEEYSLGSVEVSLTPQERFEEYLRSRKMRFTQERRTLVDYVFSQHEHFDANTLLEELSDKFERQSRPSRATVYRTLTELVEAGLLRKFEVGGRDVYEHDYGYPQHDHLYCKKCEKLIEFQSDELVELRNRVARDHGFRVSGHRLIITGICADCSAAKQRVRRRHDLI
jgi:Fur family ferric uptake transcriptional regulator